MNKYDPSVYNILCFDAKGRKVGNRLRMNYITSLQLGNRWQRMTGGSFVVSRVLFNSLFDNNPWSVKR